MISNVQGFINSLPDKRMVKAIWNAFNDILPEAGDTAITAHAGGTQAAALSLKSAYRFHNVTTVATAADSVKLPPARVGEFHFVKNSAAANAMQVYGSGTDTIDSVATATGVSQLAGDGVLYVCIVNGDWLRLGGVQATEVFGAITVDSIAAGDASLGVTGLASTQGGAIALTGGTSSTAGNAGGAVTLTGGTPGSTGIGGAVTLTAGPGGSASNNGGVSSLVGGAGTAGNGVGGVSKVVGGAGQGSGAGGAAQVTGGAGGATGVGGAVNITGGAPTDAAGGAVVIAGAAGVGTNRAGGLASVTGGASTGSATGGVASLVGGAAGAATGVGGGVVVTGGVGNTTGSGGTVVIAGGAGGNDAVGALVSLTGGAAGGGNRAGGAASLVGGAGAGTGNGATASVTAGASGAGATGNGGAANVTGGAAASTNGNGGSVVLTGGAKAGSGVAGMIIERSVKLVAQGTPTAKTTSATLTAAEVLAGIITLNQGAGGATAQQLPTAADLDTAVPDAAAGDAFDFSVINISTTDAEDGSVTTNTGWTLVGSMDIHAYSAAGSLNSSARFRARKTGAGAWTLYRIA